MLDDIKKRKQQFKEELEKGLNQQKPVVELIGQAKDAVDKAVKAHGGESDMPLQMAAKKPQPKFIPVDSQKQFLAGLGGNKPKAVIPAEESKANIEAKNKDYDAYIQELYKCIDKQDSQDKSSSPQKQGKSNFEDDMSNSYAGDGFQEKSSIITDSDEQTMLDMAGSESGEEDQNEEELEKLRPQIELDITQAQDRDDDPSFEDEENQKKKNASDDNQEEKDEDQYINSLLESGSQENLLKQKFAESVKKQTAKEDGGFDPILELLQNEPVEILQDKGMDVEDEKSEPINLADYNITAPPMPSEHEDTASNLSFMQDLLLNQFNLPSKHSLSEAVAIIDQYEEELRQYPSYDHFGSFNDRFSPKNEEEIVKRLVEEVFKNHENKEEIAQEFLAQSSSYMLIRDAQANC